MPNDPTKTEDGNISTTLWSVAICGVLLTFVGSALFGRGAIVSVAIGAALAVANLWSIARLVRGFLEGSATSWGPLGMLKLVALFVLLGVVLKLGWAEALPLALGYAALPAGAVVSQLRSASPARGEN